MFRTLEFTAWSLKTSTGVTGVRMISTQGIEMVELSATSRSLPLGRKSVTLLRNCTRARVHAIFGCARSWHVGGVVAWIPRVACCKTLQFVAALSCVQLVGVIASFKMYWKIAFVSYLFHFSGLMVLKGEYKTLSGGSYFNFVVDFEVSDFSTFLQRTHLKLAA